MRSSVFSEVISKGGFFFIFPGYFVYWYLFVSGAIPKFLGGYAPVMSMLCAACLFFTILLTNAKCNWLDAALAMFLIALVVVAYWNAAHGASSIVVESYLSMGVQWAALYLLFRSINFDNRWVIVLRVSLAIMLAFVVNYGITGGFVLSGVGEISSGLPTYQDFGVYLALCSIALLSLERKIAMRSIVFILSLVSLILLGSRSELILFLIGAGVVELVQSRKTHVLLTATLASAAAYVGVLFIDEAETNRIAFWVSMMAQGEGIFLDPLREAVNENGLKIIGDNPVFGAFAYYGPGEYAHNVLSLWADFGIGLFFLYIVMFVGTLVVFVRYQSMSSIGRSIGFPIGLWMATGTLLVVAKSFGYPAVPVLLGVASCMLNRTRSLCTKPSLAAGQAESGHSKS
jgi:hypothetical protein